MIISQSFRLCPVHTPRTTTIGRRPAGPGTLIESVGVIKSGGSNHAQVDTEHKADCRRYLHSGEHTAPGSAFLSRPLHGWPRLCGLSGGECGVGVDPRHP